MELCLRKEAGSKELLAPPVLLWGGALPSILHSRGIRNIFPGWKKTKIAAPGRQGVTSTFCRGPQRKYVPQLAKHGLSLKQKVSVGKKLKVTVPEGIFSQF